MPDQDRVKSFLNDHFHPLMREEWSNSASIWEIGVLPEGKKFKDVIVWLRSYDIMTHYGGLTSDTDMVIDTVERGESPDQPLRVLGDGVVMVRLVKQVETTTDGTVNLLVELFQVCGAEETAQEVYEKLAELSGFSSNGN